MQLEIKCIRYWFQSNCILHLPLQNISIISAPTLPGVFPVITTNTYNHLILQAGYTVTVNGANGTVTTNPAPAVIGPGQANDYVEICVTNTISTITPIFNYLGGWTRGSPTSYVVRVSSIVKNEPALLNFQHQAIDTNSEPYDGEWTNR